MDKELYIISARPKSEASPAAAITLVQRNVSAAHANGDRPVIVVKANPEAYFETITSIGCDGVVLCSLGSIFVFDTAGNFTRQDVPGMRDGQLLDDAAMAVLLASITGYCESGILRRLKSFGHDFSGNDSPIILDTEFLSPQTSKGTSHLPKGSSDHPARGTQTPERVRVAARTAIWRNLASIGSGLQRFLQRRNRVG